MTTASACSNTTCPFLLGMLLGKRSSCQNKLTEESPAGGVSCVLPPPPFMRLWRGTLLDSSLFFHVLYQGLEEIAESVFLLSVKFSWVVNVMGIFQLLGSNLDSSLPGTSPGPPHEELIVGHFKVVNRKMWRPGDQILSHFTICPQFPLACPSGAVDSLALYVICCSLLINGLLMSLLISLSNQSGWSAVI